MYDFKTLTDCVPLRNVLNGVALRDYQIVAALAIAMQSGHLILFDTGLGKTLTTVAGLEMRFRAKTTNKFIWIEPLASLGQVEQDFKKYTNIPITKLFGDSQSVLKFYEKDISSARGLLINLEAFDNPDIVEVFRRFSLMEMFDTIVIDEAHLIANPFHSNRNAFVYMLAYRIKNCYILTATPIISVMDQYASLITLATKALPRLFSIRAEIYGGHFSFAAMPELVSFKTRKEVVKCDVRLLPSDVVVERAPGVSIFNCTRGPSADAINNELLNIIEANKGSKFLIHCHLTAHHNFLKKLIEDKFNYRIGIVSSHTKDLNAVKRQFNEGELNGVIFSLTMGLNLPAAYVIMYDWTIYAAQAIGRGLRKEDLDNYIAYFLIADVEKELALCRNTVIKNGILNEIALGKNPVKNLDLGGLI